MWSKGKSLRSRDRLDSSASSAGSCSKQADRMVEATAAHPRECRAAGLACPLEGEHLEGSWPCSILCDSGCSYVRVYETRKARLELQYGREVTDNHARYLSGPRPLQPWQRLQWSPGYRMWAHSTRACPALRVSRAHEACSRGVPSSGRLEEGFQRMTCFIRSRNSWDLISVCNSILIFYLQVILWGSHSPGLPGAARAATCRWKGKLSQL